MIEKKFVDQKIKEFQVQEFISETLKNVGHSHTKLQRTPLGEKIVIYASRPGLIVGRKGESIKNLTVKLKEEFKLDNPQIEIQEVANINLDAQIVAEKIASTLERFGTSKFKGVGHKVMENVMDAGALGVEILISGKIPGARAKRWRFYQGYLKKCGDLAVEGVRTAYVSASLKTGIIGIQVRIMPPDLILPDNIKISIDPISVESVENIKKEEPKKKSAKKTIKKKTAKKTVKKTANKKPVKKK
jgi:small subunit ribosomal protein S3